MDCSSENFEAYDIGLFCAAGRCAAAYLLPEGGKPQCKRREQGSRLRARVGFFENDFENDSFIRSFECASIRLAASVSAVSISAAHRGP